MERVVKGSTLDFKVSYSIEDIEEVKKDFNNIKKAIVLLENNYLGGGDTRGNCRVKFENLEIDCEAIFDNNIKKDVEEIFKEILEV